MYTLWIHQWFLARSSKSQKMFKKKTRKNDTITTYVYWSSISGCSNITYKRKQNSHECDDQYELRNFLQADVMRKVSNNDVVEANPIISNPFLSSSLPKRLHLESLQDNKVNCILKYFYQVVQNKTFFFSPALLL